MPDLNFKIEGAEPIAYAATPTLALKLRLDSGDPEELVHTIALRCQIQIESMQRKYTPEEQKRLLDLFGQPERWDQTLRSMLWNNVELVVPSFKGSTLVNLQVPCTFDFNVAATKYFAALENGEVPLLLLFSGSIFYEAPDGLLQVTQIPWDRETKYRLPVSVWQQMMDIYYPNSAWLNLRRDVFDRLYMYKVENGIPTWEQTVDLILRKAEGSELPSSKANSQSEIRNSQFLT